MKKILVMLFLTFIFITSFSITKLTDIKFNTDISYVATKVDKILKDYEIQKEHLVGDVDIQLALKQINELGYFTSLDYKLNEKTGVLTIEITPNPVVKDIKVEILGDGLVDKNDILSNITIKKDIPLNITEYRNSGKNIQNLYNSKGYVYISINSNIKLDSNKLTLEATKVNNKEYKNGTLVFEVKEYSLWDIELQEDMAKLNKEKIKKELGFEFRKEYNNKFFLFRPDVKETYLSIQKYYQIMNKLKQLTYFDENTKMGFKEINIKENNGGELLLVFSGKPKQIIDKDVKIKKVIFKGNNSIEEFELKESISSFMKKETISNIDLLNALDNLKKVYLDNGYLYVNITPVIEGNTITFKFDEIKIGKIEISKEATSKTQDYIIDSFVKIKEGDVLNQKDLRDTYTSFTGSGFYSTLDILPKENGDKIDIILKPKESTKLRKFMFGGTWTPLENKQWYEGFSFTTDLKMPNPFGYGQTFGLNVKLNPVSNQYEFGFDYNVIKLFNSNIDMGFNSKYMYLPSGKYESTFDSTITNQVSVGLSPRFKISDFSYITTSIAYNDYTKEDKSKYSDLTASTGFLYNKLDGLYRVYNGEYLSLDVMGGINVIEPSKNYIGGNIETKYFKTLQKFTLGTRIKVGYVKDPSNLKSFYSIGGMYTVRGYEFGVLNADSQLLMNAELSYELSNQTVPVDFFVFGDYGNANNDPTKLLDNPIWSFGTGLKLTIPMLGQIRFEYSWDKNLVGKYTFGFGQVF